MTSEKLNPHWWRKFLQAQANMLAFISYNSAGVGLVTRKRRNSHQRRMRYWAWQMSQYVDKIWLQ